MNQSPIDRATGEKILCSLIEDDQLSVYGDLLNEARVRGIRLAMGGGLAASAYSGYARNTKDMDLFVVPPDQEKLLQLMREQGFGEYTDVPYDPTWSYRGYRKGFIVDVLWKMLNGRTQIDEVWSSRGWELDVRGVKFRLLPPEELIWSKLYILRRDRTDWPDILNIIFGQGETMDWERLIDRLGEDAPVLGAIMSLFRWMCPGQAHELPGWIWRRLGILYNEHEIPAVDRQRTALFNSDDWFPGR
ncbi:MAG TPA: nucleotidyltransferase family protein [Verrucomicrobiae bacterium]|nr:nucleotidyltransferase family protein [Verrucomicrobiae bacterium]